MRRRNVSVQFSAHDDYGVTGAGVVQERREVQDAARVSRF